MIKTKRDVCLLNRLDCRRTTLQQGHENFPYWLFYISSLGIHVSSLGIYVSSLEIYTIQVRELFLPCMLTILVDCFLSYL